MSLHCIIELVPYRPMSSFPITAVIVITICHTTKSQSMITFNNDDISRN